jgi:hypothetical protein
MGEEGAAEFLAFHSAEPRLHLQSTRGWR